MATEGGGEPAKKYDRIIKIFKADIPESMQEKAILRVNQGMDKFQIEKVGVKKESKIRFAPFLNVENTCLTPLSLSTSFPSLTPFYHDHRTSRRLSRRSVMKSSGARGTWCAGATLAAP